MIQLRDYQLRAIETARQRIASGVSRLILQAPTGCHRPGQKIVMSDGSTRRIEEIRAGDALMGLDGTPRTVLNLCSGRQKMARVVPAIGTPFVVNIDHILTLIRSDERRDGPVVDVSVRDWMTWSKKTKSFYDLFRIENPSADWRKRISKTTFRVDTLPEEPYLGFMLDRDGRYLLEDGTVTHNSGKTLIASAMIGSAVEKSRSTIFVAHRKELIDQAVDKLISFGVEEAHVGVIRSGDKRFKRDAFIQVASISSLKEIPKADLVIIDECFVEGTLVDGVKIEQIKVGDEVTCFNHHKGRIEKSKVTNTFESISKCRILRIMLENHKYIDCTENHPIYSNGRYVPAEEISIGDTVLVEGEEDEQDEAEDLRNLRNCIYAKIMELLYDSNVLQTVQKSSDGVSCCFHKSIMQRMWSSSYLNEIQKTSIHNSWNSILFRVMQKILHIKESVKILDRDKQKICIRKNEKKEPNDGSGSQKTNEGKNDRNRTQAVSPWRKRKAYASASKSSHGKNRWQPGICDTYENWRNDTKTISLQNRPCISGSDDCNRSRWDESLPFSKKGCGQKKRRILKEVRVESIEVFKQNGDGKPGELCEGVRVFNLEVATHHNYFANGILVHNCHRSAATSYRRIFDHFSPIDGVAGLRRTIIVGLSATPSRLDGKPLSMYEEIVVVAQPSELIAAGHIIAPRIFTVPEDMLPDLSAVKTRGGEYSQDELAEAVNKRKLVGSIIDHWIERANGMRTIVFATGVAHSKAIRDEFIARGIKAEHTDGSLSDTARDGVLARLRSGEIQVACSCDLYIEGLDAPEVRCAVLARPTQSLTILLQSCGRVMRPYNGESALILDHAGNIRIHGLPTEDRVYSLTGKTKRTSSGEVMTKTCPECYAVLKVQVRTCPECEHVFRVDDETPAVVEGRLVEISLDEATLKQEFWNKTAREAQRLGYQRGWAYHKFKERFGVPPPSSYAWLEQEVRRDATDAVKRGELNRLRAIAHRGEKPDAWVQERYQSAFGETTRDLLDRETRTRADAKRPATPDAPREEPAKDAVELDVGI